MVERRGRPDPRKDDGRDQREEEHLQLRQIEVRRIAQFVALKQVGQLCVHLVRVGVQRALAVAFHRGEFLTGDSDVQLGTICDTPFYMSKSQFEYWKHTQLILDVVPGRGGMFSLEGPEGLRFLIRSRIFTSEEIAALRSAKRI